MPWTQIAFRLCKLAAAGAVLTVPQVGFGVVLYDTDNALANTTAPTGSYEDSGWAYQGLYGDFLGTMIAPQYFITAGHIGVSTVPTFTSVATDVSYTIDAAVNGGSGFWNVGGTDLRIYKINETFSSYAPLYSGGVEAGLELVVFGRGGPRGAEVLDGEGDARGWFHTGSDKVVRWGENDVDGIFSFGGNDYLRASFSDVAGQNEASLSVGDSGGAVFVNDGGIWKLAGINYGVDGHFDTNRTIGDGTDFEAALYDRGGYYQGTDETGWSLTTMPDGPASFYASRISTSLGDIQSIIAVPEAGSVMLVMLSSLLMLRRRR